MHTENPVNPLTLPFGYVVHLIPGLDLAGIHADVTNRAGLAVILDLEDETKRRSFRLAGNRFFRFLLGIMGFAGGTSSGAGR